MSFFKFGSIKYGQCPYCYCGIVTKEGDKNYSCSYCGRVILIKNDEPKPFMTIYKEKTSSQLRDIWNQLNKNC